MAAGRGDRFHLGAEEDVDPPCAIARIAGWRGPLLARGREATPPRWSARDPPCEGRSRADSRELFPPHRGRRTETFVRVRSEPVPVPEPGVGDAGVPRDRSCGARISRGVAASEGGPGGGGP